jgi:hypothetical protein
MSKTASENPFAMALLLAPSLFALPCLAGTQTIEQEASIFGSGVYKLEFDRFDDMGGTRKLVSVEFRNFNVLSGEYITSGSGKSVEYFASYEVDVTRDREPFSYAYTFFHDTTIDSFPPLAASLFDTATDVVIHDDPFELTGWIGEGTYSLVATATTIVEDAPPDVLEFFAGGFADFTVTFEFIEVDPPANFDFDGDGDVDLTDFAEFQLCFTGPGGGPIEASCQAGDADQDDDVDLADFGEFQLAFTGPAAP